MILSTLLLALTPNVAGGDLLAIRVGRAETISQGAIEHAVVLIEDGKIVAVGQDLPIARGIPVLDHPDWVVMPGLVDCHSRTGMDSRGSSASEPHVLASGELFPGQDVYADMLETGVTTLGLYPDGSGIPGQAVAVRPRGDTPDEMVLQDSVYLKILLRTNAKSKKMLIEGFEKADEHAEKVAKELEKWEKAQEKKKKPSKSKKDDEKKEDEKKDEEKKEDEKKDEGSDKFVPPEPDPKVKPFIDLRSGDLTALMSISKASDYLHLIDALGDEEIDWTLHCPLRNEIDLFEVADKIGEKELRVVLETEITLQASTRRERNIPAELVAAGARLALIPRRDSLTGHNDWLTEVGHLVKSGLDRDAALRAVTLEPAEVLGLGERIGSIDAGKDANLILLDGDPFEPSSRIRMVMLEGEIVHEAKPLYGNRGK